MALILYGLVLNTSLWWTIKPLTDHLTNPTRRPT